MTTLQAKGAPWDSNMASEAGQAQRGTGRRRNRRSGRCHHEWCVNRLVGVCRAYGGLQGELAEGRKLDTAATGKGAEAAGGDSQHSHLNAGIAQRSAGSLAKQKALRATGMLEKPNRFLI